MPQVHAKADNITLTVTAQPGGKLRVTGRTWEDALIFMPNEVLVRWVGGQVHVIRRDKERLPPAPPDPHEDAETDFAEDA
jgi:hypothetical protein